LAGLSETDQSPAHASYVKANETLIVEALENIKAELDNLNGLTTYHNMPPNGSKLSPESTTTRSLDISGPSSAVYKVHRELTEIFSDKTAPNSAKQKRRLEHLVRLAEDVFDVSKNPRRLVWAIKDQKRFRAELDGVKTLTDHLYEIVSDDRTDQAISLRQETSLFMLQLTKTVKDMEDLLAAQLEISRHDTVVANHGTQDSAVQSQQNTTMQKVTSFAIQMSNLGAHKSLLLQTRDTHTLRITTNVDDGLRSLAILNSKPVWIEWRYYHRIPVEGSIESQPDPQSVQNVERLSWLLSQPDRPDEFRLPTCLGYIEDRAEARFGVVLDSLSEESQSLLSRFDQPNLSIDRSVIAQQLAESLLYLHGVNWLHKGLRSAGIVFDETASAGSERPGRLLISGFGFSRPSNDSFTSGGPPHDSKWSLYCHPVYLDTDRKSGYRKSYDIYSLGIILIEIAFWKPIDQILQPLHSGRDSALGNERSDTRTRILDSNTVLEQVRLNTNDRYAKATRACIEGLPAFGSSDDADEANPYVAALLQRSFIEVVIDPLKELTP
jgi:hypothetical protein